MKTTKLELFIKAIPAGILLGLADMAYLKVGKATIEGAFIFSIALLAIMKMRYCLFTGRVARLISKKKKQSMVELLIILVGNLLGTWIIFIIMLYIQTPSFINDMVQMAENIIYTPAINQFVLAMICGMLIYVATESYDSNAESIIVLVLAVVVFILIGGLHSIASTFYYWFAGITPKSITSMMILICGNSIGSLGMKILTNGFQ